MHQLAFSFLKAQQQEDADVIVLLHGAGGSRYDWIDGGIADQLNDHYSLLLPDLPQHNESQSSSHSFTLEHCADSIHHLVSAQVPPKSNTKVHLVGFSLGGYAALVTVQKYPNMFASLYLSGVYDMMTVWGRATYIAPYISLIEHYAVPDMIYRKVERKLGYTLSDRVKKIAQDSYSFARSKEVWKELRSLKLPPREEDPAKQAQWEFKKTRSMLVAGLVHDDKTATATLGHTLKRGNPQSKCFGLEGMPHAWCNKDPDLFALSVRAWIAGEDMPAGFVPLESTS